MTPRHQRVPKVSKQEQKKQSKWGGTVKQVWKTLPHAFLLAPTLSLTLLLPHISQCVILIINTYLDRLSDKELDWKDNERKRCCQMKAACEADRGIQIQTRFGVLFSSGCFLNLLACCLFKGTRGREFQRTDGNREKRVRVKSLLLLQHSKQNESRTGRSKVKLLYGTFQIYLLWNLTGTHSKHKNKASKYRTEQQQFFLNWIPDPHMKHLISSCMQSGCFTATTSDW